MLEIIGNSKDIVKIQKHLRKMFAGLSGLVLQEEDKVKKNNIAMLDTSIFAQTVRHHHDTRTPSVKHVTDYTKNFRWCRIDCLLGYCWYDVSRGRECAIPPKRVSERRTEDQRVVDGRRESNVSSLCQLWRVLCVCVCAVVLCRSVYLSMVLWRGLRPVEHTLNHNTMTHVPQREQDSYTQHCRTNAR